MRVYRDGRKNLESELHRYAAWLARREIEQEPEREDAERAQGDGGERDRRSERFRADGRTELESELHRYEGWLARREIEQELAREDAERVRNAVGERDRRSEVLRADDVDESRPAL